MKDYSKGKIYKIVGNGLTYYGSTCEPTLARRLAKHRSNYKDYQKCISNRSYVTSFKCFENNNDEYDIVLVENCPCKSKDELFKRERYFIENNECVNKNIPTQTIKEYYEKHKHENLEKKKEYGKSYYDTNRDYILKYKQKYAIREKNKLQTYRKDKYILEKEKICEQSKQFYSSNKEEIRKIRRELVYCVCGITFQRCSKHRHKKTKIHTSFMDRLNSTDKETVLGAIMEMHNRPRHELL